jgi:hypothetical protein
MVGAAAQETFIYTHLLPSKQNLKSITANVI